MHSHFHNCWLTKIYMHINKKNNWFLQTSSSTDHMGFLGPELFDNILKYVVENKKLILTVYGIQQLQFLKVHGPIFQNFVVVVVVVFHLKDHHSKNINFSWIGQSVWMYEATCLLHLPISYCVSLMITITITRHIFMNIFQTKRLSAV